LFLDEKMQKIPHKTHFVYIGASILRFFSIDSIWDIDSCWLAQRISTATSQGVFSSFVGCVFFVWQGLLPLNFSREHDTKAKKEMKKVLGTTTTAIASKQPTSMQCVRSSRNLASVLESSVGRSKAQ